MPSPTDNADTLYGTASSDTIDALKGNDIVYGRGGNDTIRGGGGRDRLYGGGDDDKLYGGSGDDIVVGGSGHDTLYGNPGDDLLIGGDGLDWLIGGIGNDTLVGGAYSDMMWGGDGADRFVFQQSDFDFQDDLGNGIMDFSRAQGDRIDFSHIDAIAGGAFNHLTFIGTAPFSGNGGEIRYVNSSDGHTSFQVDIGNYVHVGGVSDFDFIVVGEIDFVASDFIL